MTALKVKVTKKWYAKLAAVAEGLGESTSTFIRNEMELLAASSDVITHISCLDLAKGRTGAVEGP